MTILSRKKLNREKSEETAEPTPHHGGPRSHTLAGGSLSDHSTSTEAVEHLPHWSRGEKRKSYSHSHVDDYDSHDSGPSQGKRHCLSPPVYPRNNNTARSSPTTSLTNENVTSSGYNSGDEYNPFECKHMSDAEWVEKDKCFEKNIRIKGFIVKQMVEDGACLFRAVADQVYGDQEMHDEVRSHCMDYIAANRDYFSQYVTEDFDTYVMRKRNNNVHGNHIEIQAMSEMYNRTVEIFSYGTDPINIFFGKHKNDDEPIRLSYHWDSHYNSLVDPYKASVGVGLGLPSYTPGLAEKNLMKEAISQSEALHLEQAMLEDKLFATDWEATNEAIEEQVARESYLQWLSDNEKRNKNMSRTTSPCSSTATTTSDNIRLSPKTRGAGSNSALQGETQFAYPIATNSHLFSDGAVASSSSSAEYNWNEISSEKQEQHS